MDDADRKRWDRARIEVIERWRRVLERIQAHDEGEILSLTTEMDEFCDEAINTRIQAAAAADGPAKSEARPDLNEPMCHFCRGFQHPPVRHAAASRSGPAARLRGMG